MASKHLLFNCWFLYNVQQQCYAWLGRYQLLPVDLEAHFWQNYGCFGGKKKQQMVWMIVGIVGICSLQLHINDVIFKGKNPCRQEEVQDLIKVMSCFWVKVKFTKAFFYSMSGRRSLLCVLMHLFRWWDWEQENVKEEC